MTTSAMTPLLKGRPPANSFVVRDKKLVYVSVTKVACTSLRWMIADLAGEDLTAFYPGIAAHQTRLMTIHREREHWKHTPQVSTLAPDEVAEISRDNGWFIFAVVRDPWSRLWSAWQSKFLVRHASYLERFGSEPWFPRVPEKPQDVIDDFRAFVEAKPWTTHELLKRDVHFRPQVRSVHPGNINYSRVYDLKDMSVLLDDLHTHLKTVGQDRELYLPRSNETPLALIPAVLENGVAEQISALYRADFREFGERWSLDTVKMQDGWTDDAIRFAAYHTVANERIGDLSTAARDLRRQLNVANATIQRLSRQKVALSAAAAENVEPRSRLWLAADRVRAAVSWRLRARRARAK
jgi:sulfotransferase famil protein